MADSLIIRTSKLSEVYDLAPRLRADDVEETKAAGSDPLKSLLAGFKGDECFSVIEASTNKVIGMYGYQTIYQNAAIWFLGSNEIAKYPFPFIRKGKQFINKLIEKGLNVVCCAYSKNKLHLQYIECLGLIPIDYSIKDFITFIKYRR